MEEKKEEIINNFKWVIPGCCQSEDANEDNCPHVVKRLKKKKVNIGL